MVKKYDLDWCRNYARSRGGECLSSEFLGVHSALEFRCERGHVWSARPAKHIYEQSWCPQCLSGQPVPEAEVRALVEAHGFTLVGEFQGSNRKMVLSCPNGHEWSCTLVNFKRTKFGCPDCSQVANQYTRTKTRKYTVHDICTLAAKRIGECLSLVGQPADHRISTVERGQFKCADGHEWETPYSSIVRGHWCPQCAFGKKLSR